MKDFNIKRILAGSLSLAVAAGLVISTGLLSAEAFAQGMMGGMPMMHGADVILVQQAGEYRTLRIPSILEPDTAEGNTRSYTLTMDEGRTEFREGSKTSTLGYNGSYLGPTIILNRGEDVRVTLLNLMQEETTVHWHGLLVPSDADGGPHQVIEPGQHRDVAFSVKQEAATLWYHPHTLGKTARQVYGGLAGFLLIRDDNRLSKGLPGTYGVDDVPLVVQDRSFTADMQFDLPGTYSPDGTFGDTILANGTIRAAFDVTTELLRLRLLNGSNARIYDFRLSDGRPFLQIASDGGLLNEPVTMNSLRLNTAGELKPNGSVPVTLNKLPPAPDSGGSDRRFVLSGMGMMVSINGDTFDMHRVDERGFTLQDEVWEIFNRPDMMGGMTHSFHLHGTQFRVLTRGGALPPLHERGWKDTVALDSGEQVRLLVRFEDPGLFMYHCHILEHEDNGMMGQIEVQAK